MASSVVHTETYNRDGIDYEVRVVRAEGGFWGEWTCPECQESGQSSMKDTSTEKAVLSAKTNLGIHHGMKHGAAKQ